MLAEQPAMREMEPVGAIVVVVAFRTVSSNVDSS